MKKILFSSFVIVTLIIVGTTKTNAQTATKSEATKVKTVVKPAPSNDAIVPKQVVQQKATTPNTAVKLKKAVAITPKSEVQPKTKVATKPSTEKITKEASKIKAVEQPKKQ